MSTPMAVDDGAFEADIELAEYDSSDPFDLSESAAKMLEQEVNGGDSRKGDRIKLRYNRNGQAILTATQYVGVVSLPNGPTVEIQPKAAGTNLLYLLQYAEDTTATTFESQTSFQQGRTFFDAFGTLYEAELRRVINRGLQTDYQRQNSTENRVRGRIDLQRQLQRQSPTPSKFECTYDELTPDTEANRAILYATSILLGTVSDRSIAQSLRQHFQSLRRRVTLTPVTVSEVNAIQLNRLSEHYEDILRLARIVIGNSFIGEIEAGSSASFAMLVNMNTVFEKAVERAFETVVEEWEGWEMKPQDKTRSLLTGGKHQVTLKPDVTVYDDKNSVQLVADAKWKTDKPSNNDFYQMSSYMLARDAPGVLVYPDCDGMNATEAEVADQYALTLFELSTAADCDSLNEFERQFETEVKDMLQLSISKTDSIF